MKIAVNTRFLIKDKMEGLGWYTFEIYTRMARQHPEDEFVFIFDRPYHSDFTQLPNVKAKVIPPPARHPYLLKIWYEYSLPFILNSIKPDVFISPDNFCSIRYQGKTILVVHDLVYRHFPEFIPKNFRRYYEENMPRFIQRADHIVAISQATKNDIIDLAGEEAGLKTTVIYNGVRSSARLISYEDKDAVKSKFTGGRDYFLFVGAIHPRKNIRRLVEAYNIYRSSTDDDIPLVLCGRMAWETDAISREINQSPYKSDIVLTGHLNETDLRHLQGGAYALVYPSLFEGFGLPIVESFQARVPVITSNLSSMAEVAGDAALLCDPYDSENIAKQLIYIRKNRNLARNLIDKGSERLSMFDWEVASKKFYDEIKQLVNPKM